MFFKMRQMLDSERWQAVGMLKAGSSYRAVARHFGRCHMTIRNLWLKFGVRGTVEHAGKGRIRRHTISRADRRLTRLTRANHTLPATLVLVGSTQQVGSRPKCANGAQTSQGKQPKMSKDAQETPTHPSPCFQPGAMGYAASALAITTMEKSNLHRRKPLSFIPSGWANKSVERTKRGVAASACANIRRSGAITARVGRYFPPGKD